MRRPVSLTGTLAVSSALVIAIFTAAVTFLATQQVVALTVETTVQSLSDAVNASIVHALGAARLHQLTDEETARLDEVIESSTSSGQIRAVKIWDRDGRVVYSSYDRSEVGKSYGGYGNVAKALRGEIAYNVETEGKEESEEEAEAFGDVVEIYAPVLASPGGEVLGVFEVYQSYAPIQARLARRLAWVWALSFISGLLLYLVQLMVMRYAAKRLQASEHQVEEVSERLKVSLKDIEDHSMGTLMALVSTVDAKDSYTASHSLGVTEYAIAAARRLGIGDADVALLERAGLLHDIGKIGIPEAVLLKPGKLTDEEYLIVKEHSDMGSRIIESIPFLKDLMPVVRHHHERWDGKGYPDGIAGEDIPKLACVLMVADAFEAMTSDRPYRKGMSVRKAREELERHSGTQFDPACVKALLDALDAGEVGPDEAVPRRASPTSGRKRARRYSWTAKSGLRTGGRKVRQSSKSLLTALWGCRSVPVVPRSRTERVLKTGVPVAARPGGA